MERENELRVVAKSADTTHIKIPGGSQLARFEPDKAGNARGSKRLRKKTGRSPCSRGRCRCRCRTVAEEFGRWAIASHKSQPAGSQMRDLIGAILHNTRVQAQA